MKKSLCTSVAIMGAVLFWTGTGFAQTSAPNIDQAAANMTLLQTLVAGGSVMIVIGLLSVVTLALIIYDLRNLKTEKLLPRAFFESMISKLSLKNLPEVREKCMRESSTVLARIVVSGLDQNKKGMQPQAVREAIEQRARMEIANLWQNINYFSDIVAVAPLLGLLGTVLGMIQAFRAVQVQSSGMKTALLVAGISKAMVATAAGLIVAIAALIAYSYFRGKVQEATSFIELYSSEIIKKIEEL